MTSRERAIATAIYGVRVRCGCLQKRTNPVRAIFAAVIADSLLF